MKHCHVPTNKLFWCQNFIWNHVLHWVAFIMQIMYIKNFHDDCIFVCLTVFGLFDFWILVRIPIRYLWKRDFFTCTIEVGGCWLIFHLLGNPRVKFKILHVYNQSSWLIFFIKVIFLSFLAYGYSCAFQ